MATALALAAALCNALATIFERMGVETAPPDASMRWKLISHVLRRPIWFLGLAAMTGAFLFQAAALSKGGLTLVQPLLVTELLFLVVILRVWFGRPLGWREAVGCIGTVVGLGVFLAVSNQGGGAVLPTTTGWAVVVFACLAAIALALLAARSGSPAWRSAWYGSAAGVAFALCAAFIKAATTLLARDGAAYLFWHFEPYGVAVMGASGLFLTQNAYHAGPITASQASLLIVDPIASILIGVGLFGDNLRGGAGVLAVDAVALAVMSAGLFLLCHSPLIVSTTAGDRLSRPHRTAGSSPVDTTSIPFTSSQ
ncbi:MAG: DMT family transporter [Acidimicrobiales bacterium]